MKKEEITHMVKIGNIWEILEGIVMGCVETQDFASRFNTNDYFKLFIGQDGKSCVSTNGCEYGKWVIIKQKRRPEGRRY
jgi:NADPH-dependent ferric siderophore reductase